MLRLNSVAASSSRTEYRTCGAAAGSGIGPDAREQRNDVRLLELGGELDLARETLGRDAGGEVGAQDLHNDVALERRIAGEEEAAHPAATELALEGVGGAERGLELVADLFGHGVMATRAPRGARRCLGRLREGSIAAGGRKHGGERPLPHYAAEVWASPLRADPTVNFAQVARGLFGDGGRKRMSGVTTEGAASNLAVTCHIRYVRHPPRRILGAPIVLHDQLELQRREEALTWHSIIGAGGPLHLDSPLMIEIEESNHQHGEPNHCGYG